MFRISNWLDASIID